MTTPNLTSFKPRQIIKKSAAEDAGKEFVEKEFQKTETAQEEGQVHVDKKLKLSKTEEEEENEEKQQVGGRAEEATVEGEEAVANAAEAELQDYKHLSRKPIPKISEMANMKYEKIYMDLQIVKKEKRASSKPSYNGVKFDERKPGLVKREYPKRKVALLFSYCGTGYNGMQINPNVASIELDLHKALAESGAVLPENAMNPTKNQFMRCARTDKGVHAGGQVVSLKMMLIPDVIEKLNACLPDQIKAWGFARVKNSFDAKDACSSRIYEYLMPSYCLDSSRFAPVIAGTSLDYASAPSGLLGQSLHEIRIPKPSDQESALDDAFRLDAKSLTKFREILKCYEGTHNFHNFTVGKNFNDSSCKRYIMSMTVGEPFIPKESKGEWVSVKIHGQSFMLHQIRKMIGLAILMIRSSTPSKLIDTAFQKERINIPKAPALGLLLEKPLFDHYNRQMSSEISDAAVERDAVDFTPYISQIDNFKQTWIYNAISREESQERVFGLWMAVIDACFGDYSWYLNPDGLLDQARMPTELFKKGGGGATERADDIMAAATGRDDSADTVE